MRVAAVQLNSTEDKERNLDAAGRLVGEAARERAELVVLPEKFNLLGRTERMAEGAEPLDGPTLRFAADLAGELGIWLVAGSIVERKIHMFDVEVGGIAYRESATEASGQEIVTADAGKLPLGLAVCYDLRFPELHRIMALRGVRAIALPSAFTLQTGRDHWEVLLRARAIENQVFMIAAGQVGTHPPDHTSYGRSMIVDPWGLVLAVAPDMECFVVADIDFARQDEVREKLPSLTNRIPDAYHWPEPALEAVSS
jgi:predicted amidohydrolase